MAAVGLMRMSRPTSFLGAPNLQIIPAIVKVSFKCMAADFGSKGGQLVGDVERKPMVVAKAAIHMEAALNGAVVAPSQTSKRVDMATLMLFVRTTMLHRLKVATRPRPWSLIIQSFVEKAGNNGLSILYNVWCSRNLDWFSTMLLGGCFSGYGIILPVFSCNLPPFRSWGYHASINRNLRYVLSWNCNAYIWDGIARYVRRFTSFNWTRITNSMTYS